jgi:hypothetical protein
MNAADIKALKKRAEAVVRTAYEETRDYGHKTGITATSALSLPLPDGTRLTLFTKEPGGGFTILLSRESLADVGRIWWMREDLDATGRGLPMEYRVEGDAAAVIEALTEVERDVPGVAQAAAEASLAAEQSREAEREAEQQRRRQEALEQQLAYAEEHAEDIAVIRDAAAHIRKLVMVASQLEDRNRTHHRAETRRDHRSVFIPDETGIAVIYADRVLLARRVRPQFGLSIEGIRARVTEEPEGLTAFGDLADLRALLEAHRAHPFRAAARMGLCFYCAIPLTDPESRRRGYGPDCAKHHGQPWGRREVAA